VERGKAGREVKLWCVYRRYAHLGSLFRSALLKLICPRTFVVGGILVVLPSLHGIELYRDAYNPPVAFCGPQIAI
jgi:hypothetical protein